MPPPTIDFGPAAACRQGGDRRAWSSDRWFWLAPVLLGALAFAVRLPHLDHAAYFDELYHFLAAQSWLAEGQLRIAEGTYQRTSLFTIFVAQWMGVFGENLIVARLPSLIAGSALVVLVFLWTRAVAGHLAAVLATLLLALDPEIVDISQMLRFYALHCLFFWLGAIATYRLLTSPPSTPGGAIPLAASIPICFGVAFYLQYTTLIGLAGVAVWSALALAPTRSAISSARARWSVVAGVILLGAATVGVLIESGLAAEWWLTKYHNTPVWQAHRSGDFAYYHFFLTIYYPTLWPLTAAAVVVGLAYRPRPTLFCVCVVALAFVLHSFAPKKETRYFSYAQPFLFVLWGIALAEVWPRLRGLLEDVGTRALAWLRLGRLGRPGQATVLAVALTFTLAANGAFVRTMATMFDIVIPPMARPADWAAAKEPLAPRLAEASIVLTTNELQALHHLGAYDVLISTSRLSELYGADFDLDHRTGRPIISQPDSLALIMDCYPDGLIISDGRRWRSRAGLGDAVASLIEARATKVDLLAFDMRAYVWRQPDDTKRAEACGRLPAGLGNATMATKES